MSEVYHLTTEQIEAGMKHVLQSPPDNGVLELLVRRPQIGEREILQEGRLDLLQGLVGDTWVSRGSVRTADGSSHPDMQLTIMNARVIALLAPDRERWPLAGDQLFLNLDLSGANLPPGTRLALGSAVLEVTVQPHTGCQKFVARFGMAAMKYVNSPLGRQLNLRGIYTKVIQPGAIHVGDIAHKLPGPSTGIK